ncbi:hypothetical protein AWB71_03274 [Caballeronia peredens]|nr:hypothetical protein AWB71_03274 [Caballeronia peredens]
MSRATRDLRKLLERCTYSDDYGIDGSTFVGCRICERESGAGLLLKPGWHAKDCPVPGLQRKHVKGTR